MLISGNAGGYQEGDWDDWGGNAGDADNGGIIIEE